MHELSIALSIVEVAEEEAEQRGVSVSAVHLKLGRLSGVVKSALESAYALACEQTSLEGSQLVIEDIPVVVYCENCDANLELPSIQRFVCPQCKNPVSEIVQGRELEVTALEIQECEAHR